MYLIIVMLEGSANELPHSHMQEAVRFGAEQAAAVAGVIQTMQNKVSPFKMALAAVTTNEQLWQWLASEYQTFITDVYSNSNYDKLSRDNALQSIKNHSVSAASKHQDFSHLTSGYLSEEFYKFSKSIMRDLILDKQQRPDGRCLDGIRKLNCEVDIHSPLHGSALFTRGQTQVMATVTLDSLEMMTRVDAVAESLV